MTEQSERTTLDRREEYEIKLDSDDAMRLHEYRGTWILIEDKNGNTMLRIRASTEQLAGLYSEIGRKLGQVPAVTLQHLRGLREHLDGLLT